jgi:hypothetical protein
MSVMKPALGWTMLSREEMRQVERALANSDQDTRDEIGFLLIHQGFADRFFPGTSVLHERIRYALFVPWLYERAAEQPRRGSDLESTIRYLLIELAVRLKQIGGEPRNVIGGEKLGQLTSQPPDRVYWSALREWKLLLPEVDSRAEALRRLNLAKRHTLTDDDGGRLTDDPTEVFCNLPLPPSDWDNPQSPLKFEMPARERAFLRDKLRGLARPDGKPALLARLVQSEDSFPATALGLPVELNPHADSEDKLALEVARDAAALAAIGRAVYGALVEQLIAGDGGENLNTYRDLLRTHFDRYGASAARCDLEAAEKLLPDLPTCVRDVLHATQTYVRAGEPGQFARLQPHYEKSEFQRKRSRARLLTTERARLRRAEWDPERHNTTPLHYRWSIVHRMLEDLMDQP